MEVGGQDGTAPLASSTTAEEEALKRNTDCVYFLASPLTCKKGAGCEYRHSEGARVNPRDCWYWLNGNCLNPKCSFRHPPLDGLIGTSTAAGTHSQATSARFLVSHLPAACYPNKQNIPCHYFEKGSCLKGDLCPFMHGPELKKATTVTPQVPKVSTHDSVSSPPIKKASPSHGASTQQKFPALKYNSLVDVASFSGEPPSKSQTSPANDFLPKDSIQPHTACSHKSQTASIPVHSGIEQYRHLSHQSEVADQGLQEDGDGDEFLHESSPGFDVLVDGHTEDPMHFQNEEDFRDTSVHDMILNPASDVGNSCASDEDTSIRYGKRQFDEMGEYVQYMGVCDRYGRAPCDFPSERLVGRPSMSNRRKSQREETPTEMGASDLRHQLRKKRMLDGSRSSTSPDRREPYTSCDQYAEEYRKHGHNSCKQLFPRVGTTSKRLQGRIKLPRRSTENLGAFHSGREIDRDGRGNRLSEHHKFNSKIHSRRHNEDLSLEERKLGARFIQRGEGILDFAGPKSLSELKVLKSSGNAGQTSMDNGKNILSREEKYLKLGRPLGHREAESCTFEGPKPLSKILERKWQLQNRKQCSSEKEKKNREVGQGSSVSAATANPAMDAHLVQSLDCVQEGRDTHKSTKETENRVAEMEEKGQMQADPVRQGQHVQQSSPGEETYGMEDDEVQEVEDAEFENYDEGDGEYEYEVEEGEGFKTEDYENGEYLKDEGGKGEGGRRLGEKFGVLLS